MPIEFFINRALWAWNVVGVWQGTGERSFGLARNHGGCELTVDEFLAYVDLAANDDVARQRITEAWPRVVAEWRRFGAERKLA